MRSPALAIAWEFRQRHRSALLALAGYAVLFVAVRLLVLGPGEPLRLDPPNGVAGAVVVPLSAAFMYLLAVFRFGLGGDLAARRSPFPARMFTTIGEQKNQKFEIRRTIDHAENDLKHLRGEIERLAREIDELQDARKALDEKNQGMLAEIAQGEAEGSRLREDIGRVRALLEQERSVQEQMTAALGEMNQKLEAAKSNLLDLMSQEAQHRNVYQNASNNRESLKRRLKRADEEEAQTRKKTAEAQERESRAQGRLETIKADIVALGGRITDTRGRLDEKSKALGALVKQVQGLELERNTVRSKHSTLKKMEDNFEWFKDGVKAVMKHAKEGSDGRTLAGIVGLVADVIEPEASAATAVEAALGESLQYVIVDDQPAGLAAIGYLQQQSAGRSGFIPVAALHHR